MLDTVGFMDPRVEEGEALEPPRDRVDYRKQLQYRLIYFCATLALLLIFVLLTRIIAPDNRAAQAITNVLAQHVAAALPVHEPLLQANGTTPTIA
jgi:hypothetical protein